MLTTYLKLGFRNLLKNKGSAAVNIFGLTLGMTVCMLIWRLVVFETHYDKFNEHYDHIYRVTMSMYDSGNQTLHTAENYNHTGPTLKENYPEVREFVRLTALHGTSLVKHNGETFAEEENFYFTEPSLFDIFTIRAVKGDPRKTLQERYSLVLSESRALKYFGRQDPIGKVLNLTMPGFQNIDFTVGAVVKDMPENSHLKFDVLLPNARYLMQERFSSGWSWWVFYTYVLLEPGTDPRALEAKFPALIDKYAHGVIKKEEGNNTTVKFHLQPLGDIHLYSNLQYEYSGHDGGNARNLWVLLALAIFIMLIAWFNFINLSTAKAISRSVEVGVKKVLGASRANLYQQFLLESVLTNVVAFALSALLMFLLLPLAATFAGKQFGLDFNAAVLYWGVLTAALLVGSVVAGIYPAIVFSLFKPSAVLQGKLRHSASGNSLRKTLLVVQFAFSLALTLWTFTVVEQIDYMRKQDLGINTSRLVVVRGPIHRPAYEVMREKSTLFKNELRRLPDVEYASYGGNIPGEIRPGFTDENCEVELPGGEKKQFQGLYFVSEVDYDYFDCLQAKLVAGRKFSDRYAEDRNLQSAIINETTARGFGFREPAKALNRKLKVGLWEARVVGVVKDYHLQSLKNKIGNFVAIAGADPNHFLVRINGGNRALDQIREQWNKTFPGEQFYYFYLDDYFGRQYREDQRFGTVFGMGASIAILIACLGLFSFSAYSILQRRKEIGVRKVFGASQFDILFIFTRSYVKLLAGAMLLTLPVMYWMMSEWLQAYAYRIDLGAWVLLVPCLLVAIVALATVSFHVVKASTQTNPKDLLRCE